MAASNRSRAPWSWVEPPHLLESDGTAVLRRLSNPLSLLLDAGFLETTLLRHFQPLFEPEFIDILASSYPAGLAHHATQDHRHATPYPFREARR